MSHVISGPVRVSKIIHKILQRQIFMMLRHLTVQINTREYFQHHRKTVGVTPAMQSIGVKCLGPLEIIIFNMGFKATVGKGVAN